VRNHSAVNIKIKQNLYIAVIALYLVVSSLFLLNTEYQHRKLKRMLIEKAVSSTNSRIDDYFESLNTTFNYVLSTIRSNPNLIDAIVSKNQEELRNVLLPVINNFIIPNETFIAFYNSENQELYNSSLYSINKLKKYCLDVNQPANGLMWGVGEEGIFFLAKQNLFIDKNELSIFYGIRDIEGFKFLSNNNKEIPFVLIDTNIFCTPSSSLGYKLNSFVVRVYSNPQEVSFLASNIDFSKDIISKEICVNNRDYLIREISSKHFPFPINTARFFIAIDNTEINKSFVNNLVILISVIIILLILVLLILKRYNNRITNSIHKEEKKLEIQLQTRTRELLNDNNQLNQFFNSTANGIRIVDINYNIINVNDSFSYLSGVESAEIEGKKCYEVFPSTCCHTSNCPLDQILQGLSIVECREVRFNKMGEKVYCQYKAKPFIGNNGELLGIIEDFKDITDLQIAQETVSQTQKQFESLLESMPVGVFIRDFEGNIFYQNTYMNRLFGPKETQPRNLKNIYPNLVKRFFEEDKIVDKFGIFVGEDKITDSNGVDKTYVTHKFKFTGANNTPLIGGVSIDITKRKNAEHNSYVLTKAIINSPIGVLITSPEGTVEFCNPEFEKYSDSPSEKIIGQTFPFFNPTQSNKLQGPISSALKGDIFQGEVQISIYDSIQQWYTLSIAPVFNRNGDIAHLIFIFDNITQRKEFEREIVIAKTKAEESDRLKTSFLSNLSHEIRTPLNAILGFSSILNNPAITPGEKLEIPSYIVNHSNSLLELIGDLIDIAAIESNQLSIKKTECQLNNLLLDAYNEAVSKNALLTDKKIKTNIKLGVTEENFTILTDPERLTQVVRHLISNAIKFTQKGFVEFGYTFKDANNLMFYVIDSGVGLSEDEKGIIFTPFRQADDSRTRNFNGMGLGLAIAKHIVERLGGKIWVNSVKNQGSTFYFTIPYIPIRTKFDPAIFPPKTKDYFNWKSKTILVADDIDSNFVFIQTLLKPTGVSLLWAKNGREAIAMAKQHKIDLILMDIVMPEIDGFEATKQIKKFDKNVKVICQTAYPTNENEMASHESGMDSFLAKPIQAYSMLKVIDEFISKN
jgi:PAS domain S-box-containing protein